MREFDDGKLLSAYACQHSEEAFFVLVERYVALVYSAAMRQVQNPHLAQEVTQAVFIILARKAKTANWQPSVANWLYTTARQIAANALRAAQRRAGREARAVRPAEVSLLDQMTGREAFAALDEELDKLPPRYREPLVLCYLEG